MIGTLTSKEQRSFGPITAETFFQALQLWITTPPYSGYPCATVRDRLVPAYFHQRVLGMYDGDGYLLGFATWAFMTEEEFETRVYSGPEVFARHGGEILVFVDMIAPGGRNDVWLLCKELRRLRRVYPHVRDVRAHRGPRSARFRIEGAS